MIGATFITILIRLGCRVKRKNRHTPIVGRDHWQGLVGGMDRPHVAPAVASGFGLNEDAIL